MARLRAATDIHNARQGLGLLFSAAPFPGYQRKLTRLREEFGGWWYASDEPEAEGWLCPALYRYFDEAPEAIYVKAERNNFGRSFVKD
ncbi:MAG: hypothetical protein KDA57_19275 [Planctomycetales bacterium]|nr:hypothetical protein [Planctomycetales bacterium]